MDFYFPVSNLIKGMFCNSNDREYLPRGVQWKGPESWRHARSCVSDFLSTEIPYSGQLTNCILMADKYRANHSWSYKIFLCQKHDQAHDLTDCTHSLFGF